MSKHRFERRAARPRAGFTIVEVMVAIFILTVAIVGIAGVMTMASKVAQQSEGRNIAMWVARQRLEFLRSSGNTKRKIVSNEPIAIPASITQQFSEAKDMEFKASYSISDMTGVSNMQVYTVTVQWRNRGAVGASKALSKLELSEAVAYAYNDTTTGGPDLVTQLFVPPPAPPPPPPPPVAATGSSSGGTGSTPVVEPPVVVPTDPPAPAPPVAGGGSGSGSTGDTTGGTTGGSSGGSSGGTTGGGTGGSTPAVSVTTVSFGGMWR